MGLKVVRVRSYIRVRNGKSFKVNGYQYTKKSKDFKTTKKNKKTYKRVKSSYNVFTNEWKNKHIGNKECVTLVKKAFPKLGSSTGWKPGLKISQMDNPPIKRGAAIATFDKNGKYSGHAALFDHYGVKNGKEGIYAFDQYNGKSKKDDGGRAKIRFYAFKTGNGNGKYPAETYSIILK